MKSSLHRLSSFLPLFCSWQCRRLDSLQFLISRQAGFPKLGSWLPTTVLCSVASRQSQSHSHIATDGQSVSKSWCIHYRLIFTVLFLWDTLSDERIVSFYNTSARITQEHSLYCWRGIFTGPISSSGRPSVVLVRFAEMCLPSRCLAMDIHVTTLMAILEMSNYCRAVSSCLQFQYALCHCRIYTEYFGFEVRTALVMMWRCGVWWKFTEISEERIAYFSCLLSASCWSFA
jgi:hypothetical protein